MSGVTPLRPDDVRGARAWAAFVADDASATAPASLEARVLHAARAAIAQKQRADAERVRRRWFAGLGAMAASLLAAAAWSLAPEDAPTPGTALASRAAAAAARTATSPAAVSGHRSPPMTNVEAGRVLATPPQALLASRPLFHALDGAGPIGAPGELPAKSFGAPTVDPVALVRGHGTSPKPPHVPAGWAEGREQAPAAVAGSAPEAWSSRGDQPVFDPEGSEVPPPAPVYRLEHATPVPPAREEPATPPK